MAKKIMMIAAMLMSSQVMASPTERWYSDIQVKQGAELFKQNCATCHGQNAEATPNWKQTDANGHYPPPPLNGTAHAWHHDLDLLRRTIREGGIELGGVMQPFKDKLSSGDIDRVIAYFQSKWPDELYQKWAGQFEVTALPSLTDVETALSNSLTRFLRQRLGNVEIGAPQKTAIEGLWQVSLKNGTVYLMEGGKYALIGEVINLESGQKLGQ